MSRSAFDKTAFVFAGGGSLGAVEVGMLRALVREGIGADLVVGSSVGAINGAYFAGRPNLQGVSDLGRIWGDLRRRDVFPISLLALSRRNYLVNPASLHRLLDQHLPFRLLQEAALPCHIVAADVLSGEVVRISSGPAAPALMASTAIPSIFPPVALQGRYLIDGGIACNTPIAVAVRLGADRIIALPTGSTCRLDRPPPTIISMALHALNLLIARQLMVDVQRFASVVQLFVVPPLCPLLILPHDFSRAGELIERAEDSTRRWIESGGLLRTDIPGALRPHDHGP